MPSPSRELLVQFRANVPPARRDEILDTLTCRVVDELPPQHAVVVQVPADMRPQDAARRLEAFAEVVLVEPNSEFGLF